MKARNPRNGLRTSATLATVFTLAGHTVFGFEQTASQVWVALLAGYSSALLFEWVDARANGRPPGFAGKGVLHVADWLLSAHMTAITLSFLLYTKGEHWVVAFVVVASIGSKYLFRVKVDGRMRHFLNPSNFGLVLGLTLFQWTSILPWAYTTELHGIQVWLLVALAVALGTRLNLLYTQRLPVIGAFLVGFVAQATLRSWAFGIPLTAELTPLTNLPMALFVLYMITDPMTSPSSRWGQVVFGGSIAALYGLIFELDIMYNVFYAVTIASAGRGVWLALQRRLQPAPVAVLAGER